LERPGYNQNVARRHTSSFAVSFSTPMSVRAGTLSHRVLHVTLARPDPVVTDLHCRPALLHCFRPAGHGEAALQDLVPRDQEARLAARGGYASSCGTRGRRPALRLRPKIRPARAHASSPTRAASPPTVPARP